MARPFAPALVALALAVGAAGAPVARAKPMAAAAPDAIVDAAARLAGPLLADAAQAGGGGAVDVAVSVRIDGGGHAARASRRIETALVGKLGGAAGIGRVAALPRGDGLAAAQARFHVWLVVRARATGGKLRVDVVAVRVRADVWRALASGRPRLVAHASADLPDDAPTRARLGLPVAAGKTPRELGRPRRVELDLGAPVLALAAADLDGDGQDELVALTTDEVVVLAPGKKGAFEPRLRAPLPGGAPVPRPRDPIGALVAADLDGDGKDELYARSSLHDGALALALAAGALEPRDPPKAWPLCAATRADGAALFAHAELARGMNRFDGATFALDADGAAPPQPPPAALAAAACADAPTADATPWFAWVDADGSLALAGGAPAAKLASGSAGAQVALGDLDGDGRPELAVTSYRAPGDGDQVTLYRVGADGTLGEILRGDPLAGGVVGLAAADLDGDGTPSLVAAARLPGSTRADLWVWP